MSLAPARMTIGAPRLRRPRVRAARYVADLVWRCALCGYHRLAESRPDRCPECRSEGDAFVGRTAVDWRRQT
jgi:rubrerythrin